MTVVFGEPTSFSPIFFAPRKPPFPFGGQAANASPSPPPSLYPTVSRQPGSCHLLSSAHCPLSAQPPCQTVIISHCPEDSSCHSHGRDPPYNTPAASSSAYVSQATRKGLLIYLSSFARVHSYSPLHSAYLLVVSPPEPAFTCFLRGPDLPPAPLATQARSHPLGKYRQHLILHPSTPLSVYPTYLPGAS